MALDHYIPQVYLKNFYSPDLDGLLYCVKKDDLKEFTPNAKAICRTEDHSTNKYLKEPRIIEEFLKDIENIYNESLSLIRNGAQSSKHIYCISGLVAFIETCSPAAMRMKSGPLRDLLHSTAKLLDKSGKIPPSPKSLGGKSLGDLLEAGILKIDIDQKYPQAIGITNILKILNVFGNSRWEIMINSHENVKFFTSDFPVVNEKSGNSAIFNKIFPLSPSVALRIYPNKNVIEFGGDFQFPDFELTIRAVSRNECININRKIIMAAENLVFSSQYHDKIRALIRRHRNFRTEITTSIIQSGDGEIHISQQFPQRYRRA